MHRLTVISYLLSGKEESTQLCCELSVICYPLSVIGEAGGDAAEERLRLLVCRKERAPLLDGKAEGRKTTRENRQSECVQLSDCSDA